MNGKSIDSILIDVLCGTGTRYLGFLAPDRIPSNLTHFPCAYVANTAITAIPGKHWVAFYHESPTHLEFLDSMGNIPRHMIFLSHLTSPLYTITHFPFKDYTHLFVVNIVFSISINVLVESLLDKSRMNQSTIKKENSGTFPGRVTFTLLRRMESLLPDSTFSDPRTWVGDAVLTCLRLLLGT